MSLYKYNSQEQSELLKSIELVADTREQKNGHIIKHFEDLGCKVRREKLDFGDYSFVLPANNKLGVVRDLYFYKQIAIERKNGLDELAANITSGRVQFENELMRAKAAGCQLWLLVENPLGWDALYNQQYQSRVDIKSFAGTLSTYEHRYGLRTAFIRSESAGRWILQTGGYFIREMLKG